MDGHSKTSHYNINQLPIYKVLGESTRKSSGEVMIHPSKKILKQLDRVEYKLFWQPKITATLKWAKQGKAGGRSQTVA